MNKLKLFSILLAVGSLFTAANADVPPDAGRTRIRPSLILETKEDLSGYKFIFESAMRDEEVTVVKGKQTVLDSANRGGAARSGTLYALPLKSYEQIAGLFKPDSGSILRNLVKEGMVEGAVELLNHSFQKDILKAEESAWKDPVYRIEKGEKGIKAVLISGEEKSRSNDTNGLMGYSKDPKTPFFWGTVIGGSLLTLAVIIFGALFIRRSKTVS